MILPADGDLYLSIVGAYQCGRMLKNPDHHLKVELNMRGGGRDRHEDRDLSVRRFLVATCDGWHEHRREPKANDSVELPGVRKAREEDSDTLKTRREDHLATGGTQCTVTPQGVCRAD